MHDLHLICLSKLKYVLENYILKFRTLITICGRGSTGITIIQAMLLNSVEVGIWLNSKVNI